MVDRIAPVTPWAKMAAIFYALQTMLRVQFLQQWLSLSGRAIKEIFFDTPLYREFAQPAVTDRRLPDECILSRLRHRLEKHKLAEQHLVVLNALLIERSLLHGQETVALGDAGNQRR